jgi:cytosol alanyl aminopeptidase
MISTAVPGPARARRDAAAAVRAAELLLPIGFAIAACGPAAPSTAPTAPTVGPVAVAPDAPPAGRLGDSVLPRRAALELTIDPRSSQFHGRVAIDLELTEPVSAIWLHARDLSVERAHLTVAALELALRRLDSPRGGDLLGFALGQKIGPGSARLTIDYGGRLGSERGLFRQKQDDLWYAFTDFEPTDARLAVPCFDDPRFKIPWQVSLRVPAEMRAFANAPEVRSGPIASGWRRVEFAATPPLPSYLVAFAVGPFDVLEGPKASPVPMRVVATRARARLGAEALAVAPRMLAELERYLDGKTPFPKLDFLAVPRFNGAMENPGLITFSASILLVEPAAASPTALWRERYRLMAGVMAHELAHLWFGDLVTMRWWDELWLNEGLATWMSDRLIAMVSPAEAGLVLDVADKYLGLSIDRRGQPVPVRRAVLRPPEIGDQFSALIYRKGGAIVSMLEAFVGEERMQAGLRRYVVDHAHGSVTTAELAAALSASAGRDLAPVLESFLDQPGVPVVEAELACPKRGTGRPTVSLRQSPYAPLAIGNGARALSPAAQRWQVPVCVAWEGGAAPACTLLADERATVELPADRCPAWIHPNPGERGYYIYSLPPAQLRALAAARLTPREQAGLADDLDALLVAGRAPLDAALDATWSLARGQDLIAALRAADSLGLVSRSVVGPGQQRAFAARLRAAFGPLAHRLGLEAREGESNLETELREALVPLVARAGDDRALQQDALRRLMRWLEQPPEPSTSGQRRDADLDLLFRIAPLAGGPALFDRLLAAGRARAAATAVSPVSGFRQPALVKRALDAVREDQVPASPQALDLLAFLLHDGATQDQALPVALTEYPRLTAHLADAERRQTAVMFAGVCRAAARPEVEETMRRALASKGELPPVAHAVLAAISSCAGFRGRYLGASHTYFR